MKTWRWLLPGLMLAACALVWFVQRTQIASTSAMLADAAPGDLDGDGDLDVLFTKAESSNTLWINQGGLQGNTLGKFDASQQRIGDKASRSAVLGDLDGDGDLDAWIGSTRGFEIYLNSGGPQGGWQGNFELLHQEDLSNQAGGSWHAALGDLNNDTNVDAILWACCRDASGFSVWVNDGQGSFTQQGRFLDRFEIRQIALGDLDGDGDLDAWVVHEPLEPNSDDSPERNLSDQVWLNDGSGKFMDSGQHFEASRVIALVDLDGDKDLDAISISGGNLTVQKNDGSGHFNNSLQIADRLSAQVILPGDLDQDNDLDVLIASDRQAEIWLNDGQGSIQLSAQRIDLPGNSAVTLGDLNGDGDLDLFCGYPENRYKVWWNDGYGRFGLNWR